MDRKLILIAICQAAFAVSAAAQVTTDGSTLVNSVHYFKNSATQSSHSPITVSGSNVGIGTTNPELRLTQTADSTGQNTYPWPVVGEVGTGTT